MSLGNMCLCWLLIGLSYFRISRACEAPPGFNFTQPPRYWCELETQVSITNTCENEVEEIITIPWFTGGMLNRFVPTVEKEQIDHLSAYRMLNGERKPAYSRIRGRLAPGNVVLSVRIGWTDRPLTLAIRYRKTGAVQRFSKCSGMGDFANLNSSLDNTLMMSKWAVGGRSVSKVERVKVTFILPRHDEIQYVDTLATVPAVFKERIDSQTSDLNKPISIIYNGLTAEESPSELLFYVRFFVRLGAHSCPFSRNCEAENLIFKESSVRPVNARMIVGLSLGLGLAVIVLAIVTWICCCKQIRGKLPEPDGEEQVPASLTHFIHDTGNDSENNREKWTDVRAKGNEDKEEFYALDLSPRSRRKSGSAF